MRLRITARRVGLQDQSLGDLEARLRLLLGSWAARIRQAKVRIEDARGSEGGLDVRCAIEAALIPSGIVSVQGWGTDVETAVRSAARRLARDVRGDFYRRRVGQSVRGRRAGVAGNAASGEVDEDSNEQAVRLVAPGWPDEKAAGGFRIDKG